MQCPFCGNEIPDGASFCVRCGAPINSAPKKKNSAILIIVILVSILIILVTGIALAFRLGFFPPGPVSSQTEPPETARTESEEAADTDSPTAESEETSEESEEPVEIEEITFEDTYITENETTYEYATVYAYDTEGYWIWEYITDRFPATELSCVTEIGREEDTYYLVENGAVTALDAASGEVLWVNDDFAGAGAHFVFTDACICLCGYYGPDFYAVSYDGETLIRIDSFSSSYWWASGIELSDDTVLVSMEGGSNESELPMQFQVSLSTWDYEMLPSATETDNSSVTSSQNSAAQTNTITVEVTAPDGGVNLRTGAGVEYDLVYSMIPNGTILTVTELKMASSGNYWGHTVYSGYSGWIAMTQVTQIG